MSQVDTIIFDKTGTLTSSKDSQLYFEGNQLSEIEKTWVKSVSSNSSHPLSKQIFQSMNGADLRTVTEFEEWPGKGITAQIENHQITLQKSKESGTDLMINNQLRGVFKVVHTFRNGLRQMFKKLEPYSLLLMSGDHDFDKYKIEELSENKVETHFGQTPFDKLDRVKQLKAIGRNVLMMGDGLNDAGALKESNVGIAVTDDSAYFTPACDAILQGGQLTQLDRFLVYAKKCKQVVIFSFVLSLMYNAVGLLFAIFGYLTPVVSAVLMPLSSITVVVFTTIATRYFSRNFKINDYDRTQSKKSKNY